MYWVKVVLVTQVEGVPLQLFGWVLHRKKGCSEGCVEEGLIPSFGFFCGLLNISLASLVPYSLLL